MFAYILYKYHLFLLCSFFKHFNKENFIKGYAGLDWNGIFLSLETDKIKSGIQISIKNAKLKC